MEFFHTQRQTSNLQCQVPCENFNRFRFDSLWTTFTYIDSRSKITCSSSNATLEQHLNITCKTMSKPFFSTTIYVNFYKNWNVPRLDLDISHHCRECLELIGISVLSPLLFETIGPKIILEKWSNVHIPLSKHKMFEVIFAHL